MQCAACCRNVSVCPSFRPSSVYSKLESHRNFKFGVKTYYELATMEHILGLKDVVEDENVKIVFRAYLLQKLINLRQMKTKMINGPFCIYRQIHFTNENTSFCDICMYICHIQHTYIHHIHFVYSILERRRRFIFYKDLTILPMVK